MYFQNEVGAVEPTRMGPEMRPGPCGWNVRCTSGNSLWVFEQPITISFVPSSLIHTISVSLFLSHRPHLSHFLSHLNLSPLSWHPMLFLYLSHVHVCRFSLVHRNASIPITSLTHIEPSSCHIYMETIFNDISILHAYATTCNVHILSYHLAWHMYKDIKCQTIFQSCVYMAMKYSNTKWNTQQLFANLINE